MTRNTKLSSFRKLGASAAITAGLVAGGVTVASAASTPSTPHASAGANSGPDGHDHGPRGGHGPDGTVSAVSPSSITVSAFDGTSVTYAINSSTTVTKDRATASVSDLATGESVMIRPSTSSSTTAASINIQSPHVIGKVTAINGSTITVQDRDGFWRTISTTGSTTYDKSGTSSTASAVTVGEVIVAEGAVDANHTTLDATSVSIGLPSHQDGPGAGAPPVG